MSQFKVPFIFNGTPMYMSEPKTISVEGLRKRLQRENRKKGIVMSVGRPPKTQTFDCEQSKDDDGVYKCKEVTKQIRALKPTKEPKMGKTSKKDFVKPARRKPPKHKTMNDELNEQQQQFNQTQKAKEEAYALQLEKLRGEGQDRELAEMNRRIDRQNTALGFQGVASKFAEQERTINDLSELARQYLPRNTDHRGHRIPKQRNIDNLKNTLAPPPRQALDEPQTLEDIQGNEPPKPTIELLPSKGDLDDQSIDAFGNPLVDTSQRDFSNRFKEPAMKSAEQIQKDMLTAIENQRAEEALSFINALPNDEPTSKTKNMGPSKVSDTPFQPKNQFHGTDPIMEEVDATETDTQKAEAVDTDDEDEDIQADLPPLDESPLMFIESVPPKADGLFYLPKQLKELTAVDKKELFKSLGVKSDKAYTALRKERQKV
jgi:hypothetical protein